MTRPPAKKYITRSSVKRGAASAPPSVLPSFDVVVPQHRFDHLPILPPAAPGGSATRDDGGKRKARKLSDDATPYDSSDHNDHDHEDGDGDGDGDAEDGDREDRVEAARARLARWGARSEVRRARQRFPTGRYDSATGPVTVSGMNRQRIGQTRKSDFGGETMGSIPPYTKVRDAMDYPGAANAIHDPDFVPPDDLTNTQRMGTALAVTLSNVSEGDKIKGISKYIRALSRRHKKDGNAPHPLDPAVNPAVRKGGAKAGRAFMAGEGEMSDDQLAAIEGYASDSSDEDEDDFVTRRSMLKTRDAEPDGLPDKPSSKKRRRK